MSSAPPPPPARRRWPLVVLTLFVVAGAGAFAAYWFWPRPGDPMTAALAANTRGVGWMEHFEFAKAEAEFAESARLAPAWTPARVNLAISLFNQDQTQNPGKLDRARAIFNEILTADPRNTYAHYCLGVIDSERGALADSHKHFLAVKESDPADAHTWYRLGMTHPDGTRSDGAKACFEEALKRNPYLNAARYNLSQILFATDVPAAEKLAAENTKLREATWEAEVATKYSVMGKYADVIGRDPAVTPPQPIGPVPMFAGPPAFSVAFLPGHSWAAAPGGDPRPMTLFDFNRDGRPDVFLTRAVSDGKGVKNALLRNDANGTYTQVPLPPTAADQGGPAVAGDFDNDGHPDLLLVGPKQLFLLRSTGTGGFEDVTDVAGLGKLDGTFTAARWLDIDQDSDLDIVVAQGAAGLVVFENVGEAQPGQPALTAKFRRLATGFPNTPASAFVTTDIDRDGDIDLLLLADGAAPTPVLNDRLMRFHAGPPLPGVAAAKWVGGVTLDANRDERSDLFLLRAGEPPVFLLSKGETGFTPGATNSPPLAHAVAVDLDLDGWPDVVGLDAAGKPVFLHNTGDGKLAVVPDAFGAADQLPAASHALAVADLDGDGNLDLLLAGTDGLRVRRGLGNGNRGVFVSPTGRRDKGDDRRTNADGIGCWLAAQTGGHFTCADRLAAESGAGQSLLPTVLGLGRNERADALRVRWPDAVVQAEIGVAAAPYRLEETNRKGTSCPVLMTWDGERYVFVTDFLGGGALGESGPDGSIRPPRPEESVKIEAHQLRPRDGQYVLKIAEPMDEVLYLDRLRLDVVEHPKGVVVYPDERFVLAPPFPSQDLLAFQERYALKAATDERGRDVLPLLRGRDLRAVNTFATRSWLGYAADHTLTLDFGAVPAAPGRRWCLVLAGWTEYPYPESMYAATRAGVALQPPVLERLAADGKTWEPVCDLGFPAGLTRVMTRELPGFTPSEKTVLRVRTNMQVYWDHVFLAPAEELAATAYVTPLEPTRASLAARGFMREVTPYPGGPIGYDDERTEPVAVTRWTGNLTRLGDVTELLTAADDRFVLCGPGDEITVRFDATRLPAPPDGRERSFVLRTWGYCKDTSTTTVSGGRVGPLPFRAMPNYPDFGGATPPATDAARWHTRPAGGR
ncbi:VCBS repeat-containing protein [bacterium]|nr:VCBS repeat-containing protein [bacterium]